jgi:O-antigen/teichoic acid export membrane protein
LDPHERWQVVKQSRDGIYRLLIPAILGITLAAPLLLRIVAPATFRPDSLTLIVFLVALAAFPVTAVGASGRMLLTLRRSRALAVGAAVAVVVKIGLNLLLIPLIGTAGAAIGTVLAFSSQAWVQSIAIPKGYSAERPEWRLIGRCVIACVAAGLTILLPQTPLWIGIRLVIGLACLPWFLLRLRQARDGDAQPTPGARRPFARFRSRRGSPDAMVTQPTPR